MKNFMDIVRAIWLRFVVLVLGATSGKISSHYYGGKKFTIIMVDLVKESAKHGGKGSKIAKILGLTGGAFCTNLDYTKYSKWLGFLKQNVVFCDNGSVLPKEHLNFFIGHEMGHLYLNHLNGGEGILADVNKEIEADKFSYDLTKDHVTMDILRPSFAMVFKATGFPSMSLEEYLKLDLDLAKRFEAARSY
jgi:hypothetical protein